MGICILTGGIFILRAPLVLVDDAPFTGLYGPGRLFIRQWEISLRFFRPLRSVRIGDTAGPDIVAFAVEESAKTPYAVLFPYRYYEGARRYGEKFPGVPVFILGDQGIPGPLPEGLSLIGIDTRTDYFRAGLAAAVLLRDRPGKLLVFQNEKFGDAGRAAFMAGLRGGEYGGDPLFLGSSAEYTAWEDAACAVVTGQAAAFLDRNLKIPVILFSWLDPAMTPASVKIIFDDSPWALALRIFSSVPRKGEGGLMASDMAVLSKRIGDPEMVRFLQEIANKTLESQY